VPDLVDAYHAYHSDRVRGFDDLSGIPSEVRKMIRITVAIGRFTSDPLNLHLHLIRILQTFIRSNSHDHEFDSVDEHIRNTGSFINYTYFLPNLP